LIQVYLILSFVIASTIIGVAVDIKWQLGGYCSHMINFILILAISLKKVFDARLRFKLFIIYGFLQGISLGSLISIAIEIDPMIPIVALSWTIIVFIGFSISAFFFPRRLHMYLGSFLFMSLIFLLVVGLTDMFWCPVLFNYQIQVYFGLVVFCLFIVYDTQYMIHKIKTNSIDPVTHALDIFQDFISIFIRILLILMDKEKSSKKKKNKEAVRDEL